MTKTKQRFLLPAATAVGSFLCLMIIVLLSSPLSNLSYIIVFFMLLLILLVSLGHLFLYLGREVLTARSRYKVFILSFVLVILLMLDSAQSLNPTDFIILLLIAWGLIFYSSKRTS
jgi:hypothetical protein